MNDGNNQVLVLTDDFTGANDAGVSLTEAGISVKVAFGIGQPLTVRALILNSDNRTMSAAATADKITGLPRGAAGSVPHWQMRKIDSTLRGNLGGELETMMAAHGYRLVMAAPAYSAVGRHTRDGRCYVHRMALDQTEPANNPKTPVSRAKISEITAMQSRLPYLTLNAAQLPEALATTGGEKRVSIVDAWEDGHLDQVIDAIASHVRETLPVSSAGSREALAHRLCRREQRPLLALVDSVSEMAQYQVATLQAHSRVRKTEIGVGQTLSRSPKEKASWIVEVLREGYHCTVATRLNNAARHGTEVQCNERGFSRTTYREHICAWLAGVTTQTVVLYPPDALCLSGGDITIVVAYMLGATELQIRGRVTQCMPYGHFLDDRWSRPVMAKAEGFGTDTTLLNVVNFIEERLDV